MRPGTLLWLLVCALCVLFALPAQALPPQRLLWLKPPEVSLEGGMLTLQLSLSVDNEDGLRDLLKDGAVLELRIVASVERERSWWSNAEAVTRTFSSQIRHDPLSRDFITSLPTLNGTKELRDRNLTRLLYASWKELDLPVALLADVLRAEEAENYALSLIISLQHTDVPPWLEKTLVFWSKDVVPEEKRTLHFTVPDL